MRVCLDTFPKPFEDSFGFPAQAVFNGRYRLDTTNWDSAIIPRGSPDASLPAAYTAEIANNLTELSGQAFNFTVTYTPGKGYTWTLAGQGANPGPFPLEWSLYSTPGGEYNNVRPVDYYNAIQLRASAFGVTGQSLSVTNLSFNVIGAQTCGSLPDLTADYDATQTVTNWLVATGDLSQTSWTLTGTVTGVKPSGGQESVTLNIYTVPLPAVAFTTCGQGGAACPVSRLCVCTTVPVFRALKPKHASSLGGSAPHGARCWGLGCVCVHATG